MPRFFDDYSNTYLTHDSSAGRKQQRRGWKFRENFKLHYEKNLEEWRSGPMGLAAAQQAYIRTNANNPNAIPPLPQGWKEEEDGATRATYYINKETGDRTWVRPGFIPSMGGPPPSDRMMNGPPPNFPPPNNMYSGPPPPIGGGPLPPPIGGFAQPPPNGPPPMGHFPPPPHLGVRPPGPPPGGFQPPPGPPPGGFQQPPPGLPPNGPPFSTQ